MKSSKDIIERVRKDIKKHEKNIKMLFKEYCASDSRGFRVACLVNEGHEKLAIKALKSVLRFGLKS